MSKDDFKLAYEFIDPDLTRMQNADRADVRWATAIISDTDTGKILREVRVQIVNGEFRVPMDTSRFGNYTIHIELDPFA